MTMRVDGRGDAEAAEAVEGVALGSGVPTVWTGVVVVLTVDDEAALSPAVVLVATAELEVLVAELDEMMLAELGAPEVCSGVVA